MSLESILGGPGQALMSPNRVREEVKDVFKKLKKKYNIYTRVNFQDCMSCALAAIDDPKYSTGHKKKWKGYAYWHEQDDDNLFRYGVLHIRYSGRDDVKDGYSSQQVGNIVYRELSKAGLPVSWSGSSEETIKVRAKMPRRRW